MTCSDRFPVPVRSAVKCAAYSGARDDVGVLLTAVILTTPVG